MNGDHMFSLVSRFLFGSAFVLLVLAILERLSNAFGFTLLRGMFTGGRLLEITTVLLMFVLALLLRQVRDELKKRNA